jgi:rhodanese-related sulfurtransferase
MKTLWRFFFFPTAALCLGTGWHLVHPSGLWSFQKKAPADGFARVTWSEAAAKVASGEWLLIDARVEEEYAAAHIPGAVSLPSHSFPEMITFFSEEQSRDKTAVIYCDTAECDRSVELARRLQTEAGWTDLRILDGGMLGWKRSRR